MPVCYSNLNKYGTDKPDRPIIAPTPVYTVFQPFNVVKPHNFNPNSTWNNMNTMTKEKYTNPTINQRIRNNSCASNSFRGEFTERSQLNRENQRLNVGFFSQRYREMSGF